MAASAGHGRSFALDRELSALGKLNKVYMEAENGAKSLGAPATWANGARER